MSRRPSTSNLKAEARTEQAAKSGEWPGLEKFRLTQQNEQMTLPGACLEWRDQI